MRGGTEPTSSAGTVRLLMLGRRGGPLREGHPVTGDSLTGQDRARRRLTTARDHVRRRRGEVMLEVGRLLRIWRDLSGILQQDLAAEGCVSATVVRRIEKGDYESAPPESLIAAVSRLGGPARGVARLGRCRQGPARPR